MATRMQQRRGLAAQWISTNSGQGPVLNAGEIGFEIDNNRFKIGDGVSHWISLPYFSDNQSLTDLIDGAPDLLNTLGELAAAIGDDEDFVGTVTAHTSATTNVHGILDTDDLATKEYVTTEIGNSEVDQSTLAGDGLVWDAQAQKFAVDTTLIQERVTGVSDTEIGYLSGVTSDIQTQIDSKLASADLDEAAQEAVNTALVAGTGLDKSYDDNANTITLNIDSTVATKSFAAGLLTGATKTNITITGDENGLTISAENGVADSNTDNLSEGSTNKYFTDERAQDAVGNAVGTGLSYNDSTGALSVTANTYDPYGSAAAITASSLGLGNVDNTSDVNKPVSTATQTALDLKAPLANPTFTGTVAGVTKAHVGLGDVDNTSDAAKPVSTATQTALDAKLALAGGTMTGSITLPGAPTSDLHAATKLYVDNVAAGINFHEAVHAASVNNLATIYDNGTSGVGATLTADTNRAFSTLDGESVVVGQRVLIKNQTDAKQNGIYTLTTNGSVSAPWVLTRATDADNNPAGEMKTGDFCFVINGTVNASVGFVNSSTASPIVIGTDNITYAEFNAAKTIVAGNGLTEATPGVLSIDTSITQARVSGVSDTEIGYLNGVTSAIQTQIDSKEATLPSQSGNSGKYLTNDGSGTLSWGTVSGYSEPTLGSTSIASGATVTTVAGLTLSSPTLTGTVTLPLGKLTGGSTTVSGNTATTVSTVALADFTTMEYTVSIKQGSKIRSSKVLVQTDGTTVDSVEHSILETGGAMSGVNVTAAVSSTNAILTVTITNASTTNATVNVINTII
jgi:trimeric autotransporter adhesin